MLTVITPATSKRLATVETVRMDIPPLGDAGDGDSYIDTLIDQTSAAVAAWCGRSFGTEVVRETLFSRSWDPGLLLSRSPVVAISSVSIGGTVADPETYTIGNDGCLYLNTSTGAPCGWPRSNVTVQYSAGYILPGDEGSTLPLDIERAVVLLVKSAWFTRNRDPLLKSDEVTGVGVQQFYATGPVSGSRFPAEVEGLLTPYRMPVIG